MAQPADRPAGLTNLQKRILSAAVLLPATTAAIAFGHPYFELWVAAFAGVMGWEWAQVCSRRRSPRSPAAPAARLPAAAWHLPAIVLILTAVAAVLSLGFAPNGARTAGTILGVGAVLTVVLATQHHAGRALWFPLGAVYTTVPALCLVAIRNEPDFGQASVFWIIALVVAADTGGYLVGRTVGGPKL